MTNPHGSHIWYELMTNDPAGAKAFYDPVVGWSIDAESSGEIEYRMICTSDGPVAGLFRLTEAMVAGGARPAWLGYIGVDDVDATVARLRELGGAVHMEPFDIADVGRLAFVADPEGVPFYVMRGLSDEPSSSFAGGDGAVGHCNWNELSAADPEAAFAFYSALFGWEKGEGMDMGPMGTYQLLDLGGESFGAVMPAQPESPQPHWTYYFRVDDIDAARDRIEAAGGTVFHGPVVVPGDDYIILGGDPQGAAFALVGPRLTKEQDA